MNFRTTKEELTELLSAAGTIVDVHIPTDRESGRPRGFAFVKFSSDAEAAEAIRLFNGHELAGRKLNINEAEDRPRQGGGGPPPRRDDRPPPRRDDRPPPRPMEPPPPEPDFNSGRLDAPPDFEAGDGDFGGGGRGHRGKGSRRGLRARKRSL